MSDIRSGISLEVTQCRWLVFFFLQLQMKGNQVESCDESYDFEYTVVTSVCGLNGKKEQDDSR